MKYVLFYETAADGLEKAPANFPAHRARVAEYHDRGVLPLIGTFADPQDGAMGIFTTREDAETFATGDPFVINGVVASWKVQDWNEIFDT